MILKVLLFFSLWNSIWAAFTHHARTNTLIREGTVAYELKEYDKAAAAFHSLLHNYNLQDDQIRLNLAHCLFLTGDTAEAGKHYEVLFDNPSPQISSTAYQQKAIILWKNGQKHQALDFFRNALLTEPYSEAAARNFELAKKILESEKRHSGLPSSKVKSEKKKSEPETEIEKQSGTQIEKSGIKNQNKSELPENSLENMELRPDQQGNKERNILRSATLELSPGEQKARLILDAMKNQEVQYLQQKKKGGAGEGKVYPDW